MLINVTVYCIVDKNLFDYLKNQSLQTFSYNIYSKNINTSLGTSYLFFIL